MSGYDQLISVHSGEKLSKKVIKRIRGYTILKVYEFGEGYIVQLSGKNLRYIRINMDSNAYINAIDNTEYSLFSLSSVPDNTLVSKTIVDMQHVKHKGVRSLLVRVYSTKGVEEFYRITNTITKLTETEYVISIRDHAFREY